MEENYAREYEDYEQRHWWHVARREIICDQLARALRHCGIERPRWLDVGCGPGVLLDAFHAGGEKIGIEVDPVLAEQARRKGLNVWGATEGRWDFSEHGAFDLITLCDVIEHVEDDAAALDAARAALRDGGVLLVTVPALRSLWSNHDVVNHHFRRYERADLARLFPRERWDVLKLSYFSSVLFPLIWSVRRVKNRREAAGRPPTPDKKFGPPVVDAALLRAFRCEVPWLRRASFPIGSSLLLVARKRA